MAQRDETDARIELSQALWELRCGIARLGDPEANKTSFGRMLTDPGYRARVIRRCATVSRASCGAWSKRRTV